MLLNSITTDIARIMKTKDIRCFMQTLQALISSSSHEEEIRVPIQEQPETEPEEGREEVSSITLRNDILVLGGAFHKVESIALQWATRNKQRLRVNWSHLESEQWVTNFIYE